MLLVLVEHAGGKPSDTSLQALTLARAYDPGLPIGALLAGAGAREAAGQLGSHGVANAYVIEEDGFAPDAWAALLEALADQVGSPAVFAAGTDRGNEVMARLAARTGLPSRPTVWRFSLVLPPLSPASVGVAACSRRPASIRTDRWSR